MVCKKVKTKPCHFFHFFRGQINTKNLKMVEMFNLTLKLNDSRWRCETENITGLYERKRNIKDIKTK